MAHLAQAVLGPRSKINWTHLVEDYGRIRDLIERVFPMFQGYNARIALPGRRLALNAGATFSTSATAATNSSGARAGVNGSSASDSVRSASAMDFAEPKPHEDLVFEQQE